VIGGSAGITITADGSQVLVVGGQSPILWVIDTHADAVAKQVTLHGHAQPAQRVRCSPDGRSIVVTATEEPLVTLLSADLETHATLEVHTAPMGVAFHPDGRTALVANHGAGRITVIDLESRTIQRDFACGVGVETMAFY